MKIAFLSGIPATIEDAGLSDSYVEESFLEHELAHARSKSKSIIDERRKEIKTILNEISDIVSLEPFSTHEVDRELLAAEKVQTDTIQNVNDLDRALTSEYEATEINEEFIAADFQALFPPQGKAKTPPRSTIMPRLTGKVKSIRCKQDYISSHRISFVQKRQAEERRIAKEQEELANRPWYEKCGVLFMILQERLPDITIISGSQMELIP